MMITFMGDAMLNNATDHAGGGAVRRMTRTRALLDIFEEECGRPPKTIAELRDWMGAQYLDQLQIRMDHWLKRHQLIGNDAGSQLDARGQQMWMQPIKTMTAIGS
jgi:hypothetical protein